jgi:ribosomal protein L24E
MTTELEQPSPLELRAELLEMVRKDLLGPAAGPEEEVDEANVRGRYIVGLLAPRGQSILPDEQDELGVGGSSDAEETKADTAVPQTASMLPSAVGLTFTVEEEVEHIQVTARYGRYHRVESEVLEYDDGSPRLVWKREPVEGTSEPIPLKPGPIGPWHPEPENPVYVRGLCRRRDDTWTVTLYLINGQREPKRNKDSAWVFQPQLVVRTPEGDPAFVKRQIPPDLSVEDPEDRAMEMLYRRHLEFAVGHGVAVHATRSEERWDRAVEIRTEVMPTYEVEQMKAPAPEDIPLLDQACLDMQELAGIEMGNFASAFAPLLGAYANWIEQQEAYLATSPPDLTHYEADAVESLKRCRDALKRIQEGIELLDDDPQAAQAFRFANRAMHLQRIRSIYARAARQDQNPDMAKIDVPENRKWYPFQLAFVLLNLPALADPTHPDRSHPTEAIADLLWFPTGGGKTEAYLGVAAFAMGIRRLQGEMGGRSGRAGVTVLMRYTLRLLTLQQFQRATALICACEIIRRKTPSLWGDEPFRIGLWVGMRSTPNWTDQSAEAIKREHGMGWGGAVGGTGSPHQLTNCPWCGKPIDPGKNNIQVETYGQGRARTFQYCSDKYGQCPFSYKQSPDEGVPIVVVDEEIYRRLPALVIATVDKFAQMPWKGETQMLFGQVNGYCPRHGFRSPEIEDRDRHRKSGRFPAVETQDAGPLRPPDLIIQDELHLISGPLGTLVGLYETAVDHLASWELDGQTVRPKVVASTATIRRASNQVHSLFLRQVQIFPPSGLDASDNFFSQRRASSDESPGRLYLGICAPGTRLKTALIRVYVAHMAAAQVLYEKYGRAADPWMTLIGYFNSMRELGGMRRVVDDAVRTRLQRMDQRGLAKRFIHSVEELTSRKGSTEIPHILDRLEAPFDPQAEKVRKAKIKAKEEIDPGKYPLDVVLATNMISVGVDVSRLGLMVVASQPKATAEYIQATSRVGRKFPGVVCTVYNWARPRDLSHYERFEHYHATFYQQVEALSVTPFSPRALDRGLTGVLVSYIRLLGEKFNANEGAGKLERQHAFVDIALDAIARRGELISGSSQLHDHMRKLIEGRLDEWLAKIEVQDSGAILGYQTPTRGKSGRTVALLKKPTEEDWDTFTCLNSLRDVEPNVPLILKDHGMDGGARSRQEQSDKEETK